MAMRTVPSEADQTREEDCWLCTTATSGKYTKWSNEEHERFVEWAVLYLIDRCLNDYTFTIIYISFAMRHAVYVLGALQKCTLYYIYH